MAVFASEYIAQLISPPFLVLAKSRFFLFSYSEKGAKAAGILMTVIRTVRLNQADPEKYIAYVLTQLGKTSQEDIDSFLPWSETLPKEVRSSKYEVPKSVVGGKIFSLRILNIRTPCLPMMTVKKFYQSLIKKIFG